MIQYFLCHVNREIKESFDIIPLVKVYHYTKPYRWDLHDGSQLLPLSKQGEPLLPPAIFGLLSPRPSEWLNSSLFGNVYEELRKHVGDILLELDIEPADPNISVVDVSHMRSWNRTNDWGISWFTRFNVPMELRHATREEALQAYASSRIPLEDYLSSKETLGYALPEVIITRNVPLDEVRIQPGFEKFIEGPTRGFHRDNHPLLRCKER